MDVCHCAYWYYILFQPPLVFHSKCYGKGGILGSCYTKYVSAVCVLHSQLKRLCNLLNWLTILQYFHHLLLRKSFNLLSYEYIFLKKEISLSNCLCNIQTARQ